MSSLSGTNSLNKGDKKKFSTIDLSKTYQGKGGEAQKSTGPRQHGLQSLGKVPASRRIPPPAQLPSLKSENSGNDPTVNLVPSGPASTGWGSGKTSDSQQQSGQQSRQHPSSTSGSAMSRSAVAREMTSGGGSMSTSSGGGTGVGTGVGTGPHPLSSLGTTSRPWSSVTSKNTVPMFDQEKPAPPAGAKESGRFTRDFPTLDGAAQVSGPGGKSGGNTQLDLRPQNVGSWREGGGKSITSDHPTDGGDSSAGGGSINSSAGGGSTNRRIDHGQDSDDERDNYQSSNYNGRMYIHKHANQTVGGGGHEDTLFKRPTIVKDRDIEELGHKAATRANNDDSSWATASGEIDYSVKLVFSDDEDNGGGSKSSSGRERDTHPKRSTPPDTSSKSSVDGGRRELSDDRASQSEMRSSSTGGGYDRDGGRGRPSREAWLPHQYHHQSANQQAMMQQRMPYDGWSRSSGKMSAPNMPHGGYGGYRMPYRPAVHHQMSAEDDEDMWRDKRMENKSSINAAVERAKNKRGEESEESRRSRSTSESSSSEQTRPHSRSGRHDNRKPQNQVPPRFQKNAERSAERGSSVTGHRNDENRPPYHSQHSCGSGSGGQTQQPQWQVPWPVNVPPPWMTGNMQPPLMPPSRPRNNSRGSDDERRPPEQQGYGIPAQYYEMQVRWMAMMQEYAKNNPGVPMPPLPPPLLVLPPRQAMPHPSQANQSGATDGSRERKPSASESPAMVREGGGVGEKSRPTENKNSDPFDDGLTSEISNKPSGGGSKTPSTVSNDRKPSSKEDTSSSSRQNRTSTSSRGERREDKRGSRTDEKSSNRSKYDQDGSRGGRQSKYRDDVDSREVGGAEGRKRRSEMSAPVPVVKETLRDDPDRQRQMVTLKRSNKSATTTTPVSTTTTTTISSAVSSAGGKVDESKGAVSKQSSVTGADKSGQKPVQSKSSDRNTAAPPKQSAWAPTPVPQAIPISAQESEAKAAASEASKTKSVSSSSSQGGGQGGGQGGADGAGREDRSKVSPAYSDSERPPAKRYKEEREYGGGSGGRYDSRSTSSRGGRLDYPSERGSRRGGARSREFVRGGSASAGRGVAGRSGGLSGRGTRSVSSRGRGGGSSRGSYEGSTRFASHDYRESTYTAEDWEGERTAHKKDPKASRPEANGTSKDSGKLPARSSKEVHRQSSGEGTSSTTVSSTTVLSTVSTTVSSKPTTATATTKSSAVLPPAAVVSEAPPPKENIWDKRKQEMSMRDTPSPTPPATAVSGTAGAPSTADANPTDAGTTKTEVNAAATVAEQTSKETSTGGDKPEDKGGEEKSVARREDGRRKGRGRPTRDTYIAPGSRARGGSSSYSRQPSRGGDYYEYGDSYDERYSEGGRYGRGSSRSRGSRGRGGYQSGRGRHPDSRGASRTNSRDDGTDRGPTIDQWNGPPDDSAAPAGKGRGESWDKEEHGSYQSSYRGRGRGRGGKYPTRGSSTRGGRGRHTILPSAAHSPSKRRQDSTNTENDPQEEWETASESSEHLKDSAPHSSSRNSNKHSDKVEEVNGGAPHDRSNGPSSLSTSRGPTSRNSYRGSGERGRGRGSSRGGGSRGGYRGSSAREGVRYKEKTSDDQNVNTSANTGGRGARPLANGKSGSSTVYRLDGISLDNPSAVAAALSNKNSELSDVSKPLSSKERSSSSKHNHSSSTKEQVSAPVADPLDGIDLNNYAGVVIIDDMGDNAEDSDGWQDEDGFQEVVSRKTRKEKQRQEQEAQAKAAAKAKAVEIARREKALVNASRKVNNSSQRNLSPGARARKSKLPPRFQKHHHQEERSKHDRFKIEQWDNEMMDNASHTTSHSTPATAGKSLPEPPVQIGNWDQNMAAGSSLPAPTSTLTTNPSHLVVGSSSISSLQSPTATTVSVEGKPVPPSTAATDKNSGSEQHDSGIDVSNDRDTGSVRSSPDAGSAATITPQIRQGLIGQSQHSHFPSVLSPPQRDPSTALAKTPIVSRQPVAPLGPTAAGGLKIDFTFDPKLAHKAEVKEQGGAGSASETNMNMGPGASEVSSNLNLKLDSVKTLWDVAPPPIPTPQNPNTNQPSTLFGSQAMETSSYQKSPSEAYEQQVDIGSATVTYSSNNDVFPASRNDGFQEKPAYHVPTNSQSATNMFVSPGSSESNPGTAIGSRQQPSPRAAAGQLMSPRSSSSATSVAVSAVGGVSAGGAVITTSSPHSSQSTLDGGASVFTPSYQPATYKRSPAPAQSPSAASLSSTMLSHQPVSQGYNFISNMMTPQNLTDSSYQPAYRNQPQPSAQQPGHTSSVHQNSLAQVGLQQAALQVYQQKNMVVSSQHFPQPMLVSTPTVMSSMVKPNTVSAPALPTPYQPAKVGQFDASALSSTPTPQTIQQQMQYVPTFDVPGIMGGQTAQQSAGFRLPAPQSQTQLGQQAQSPFYGAPTQTQNLGYFTPSTLQGSNQSGFAIGLMSAAPPGTTMVPQGGMVLGQQAASAWAQPSSVPPQTLKQYKSPASTGPAGNQMKVQMASHPAAMTSQPHFQMTTGGSTFTSGQPSTNAADFSMGLSTPHHHQSAAGPPAKWNQPTNQQQDKSHMGGANQLVGSNQISGTKMGGASMMTTGSQMSSIQKSMQNLKPGFQTAGPQRPGFNPRMSMPPPPLMAGLASAPTQQQQQQNRRHPSPHATGPRAQYPVPGASGMGRAGTHPSASHPSRFAQPPIQRPVQNRHTGRSSKTPPTNSSNQMMNKTSNATSNSQHSAEEKMKERAAALTAAKNFLNPENKPNRSQTAPPAPPPLTSTPPATLSKSSVNVANPTVGGGAAGDTTQQVSSVSVSNSVENPTAPAVTATTPDPESSVPVSAAGPQPTPAGDIQ